MLHISLTELIIINSVSEICNIYRDATHSWILGTVTQHYRNGEWVHGQSTGWQTTWRSAAVHWGEAVPGSGWEVKGYHWIVDSRSRQQVLFGTTDVYDCSIYDGW